jgi:hypothetical protein
MRNLGILLLLAAGTASANLVGWNSLADLGRSADLVVVADPTGLSNAGTVLAVTMTVTRVLKGDAGLAGTSISAVWTWQPGILGASPDSEPAPTGSGLWFFKSSPGGWQLLSVMQGGISFNQTFIAVPRGPIASAYSYAATASLNDKIASEVSAAIEGGNGAWTIDLHRGILDQLGSPVLGVLYRRLAASRSGNRRILGLAGLIRQGSVDALSTAMLAPASLFASCPLETGVLMLSIRDDFRAADAPSIAVLGQAALDSRGAFREVTAFALRSIHTVEALPYLAALMDDPDLKLRAEGIGGFSAFANGLPVQTPAGVPSLAYLQMPATAVYKTQETMANFAMGEAAVSRNEAKLLAFWKGWWTQNRAALGY